MPTFLSISLAEPDISSLLSQMKKATEWADFIEIRLDALTQWDAGTIVLIDKHASLPLIWTFRHPSQGGGFQGTEEEWTQKLFILIHSLAMKCKSTLVDIDAGTAALHFTSFQKIAPQIEWIISWHQFNDTPDDEGLQAIYEKISRFPAKYYKIATQAKTTMDALRLLYFSREHNRASRNLCAIAMGELGTLTRILAGMVGQPFTYAALKKGKETAPGQLTASDLIEHYHFRQINDETEILGLIGRPVDKSMSHLTHNAVLQMLSRNAVYLKFCLKDDELCDFLKMIALFQVKGLSVTMPFKEKILSFLKNSSTNAFTSCNTLVCTPEVIDGFNTDGVGAMRALNLSFYQEKKILILGAGGTAKAIAQAAHQMGSSVAVLNRTVSRAREVALSVQGRWGELEELPKFIQEGYHILIQATSVGMMPCCDEMIMTPTSIKDWRGISVLDVISNPPETRFLREIKKLGGKTISGRELFVQQAVEQFVHWYGPLIPKDEVEMTIRHTLSISKQPPSIRARKSRLKGFVVLPPSKSHTIRAILLAALTKGISLIDNVLDSPDTLCAIHAAKQFGAKISATMSGLAIEGVAGHPHTPSSVIDAGNSGQVLRFAAAIAALSEGATEITGDHSICSNRPILPLIEGLRGLHVTAESKNKNGYAPFVVKGPMRPGNAILNGEDSQPVSALLLAASFLEGESHIDVINPGEKPWLALTLTWLDRLGVTYSQENYAHFTIQGKRERSAFDVMIPGDLSALAFPLAAALITHSELTICGADLDDVQGDKRVIYLLQKMGACIEIDAEKHQLTILPESQLKGQVIDANDFIDAVPILAVLGCFAEGETEIVNASVARKKESNRLACITAELKKMGARIEETETGLFVKHSPLCGAILQSHDDHRLAMSLIVAGLAAEGTTTVQGVACIAKSYPSFIADMRKVGALIDDEK